MPNNGIHADTKHGGVFFQVHQSISLSCICQVGRQICLVQVMPVVGRRGSLNPIKNRIIGFLAGEKSAPVEALQFYFEKAMELISIGIENDADVLLYAHKANREIFVVGLVGKSIIQGRDLNAYLELYFADSEGLASHVKGITDYIYEDLSTASEGVMVLRAEDRGWRSFKPIKNVDDIKGKTISQKN